MTTLVAPPAPSLAANGGFKLLWFGEGVSLLGHATSTVLLPLAAVVEFHAGPGWMGLLAAASWLPWLVIGLPAGAWVDRLPARRVMIACDLVAAATAASVPLAWVLGLLTLPHLLVVALCGGVCTVFFRTAYVVILPQLVRDDQLESANARLFGTESAMQVAGPGLGGLLAQAVSAAAGLAVGAVGYLVSAVSLSRIRPSYAAERPAGPAVGLTDRIREGVQFVARDRYLRWMTIVGGVSNFGLTGFTTLLVLFLARDVGLEPAMLGVVMMLGSFGGLVGAMAATRVNHRLGSGRATKYLLLLSGPSALLVALGDPGWRIGLTVIGLALVGLGTVAGNVVRGAWRQRYVPRELMGRALTAAQFVNFGTMPLAGLVAGSLGGQIGVREALFVMASVHAAACMSVLWGPIRRLRDLPDGGTAIRN